MFLAIPFFPLNRRWIGGASGLMDLEREHPEPSVPPRLADAIRAGSPRVSAESLDRLDAAVLGMAATRRRGRRQRMVLYRFGGAMAAAAGLAIAVSVAWWGRGGRPSVDQLVLDPGEPVTILHAFRLAKLIEQPGAGVSPTWDVTADGVVDQRDVEALAARAVRLTRGQDDRRTTLELPGSDDDAVGAGSAVDHRTRPGMSTGAKVGA